MIYKKIKPFPKNFLWGSASSAYQIEGAFNKDGKGLSVWDVYTKIEGNTYKGTNGDEAVDHYHRYKEDVALMKEMGLKAYRFSISWSRILPNGKGEVNEKGIQFYSDLIDELLKAEIEPILTIYHWDLPKALEDEYGGWKSRKIINDFENYCRILYKYYGERVKYWVSLNEQNVFVEFGYLQGMHPPKMKDEKMYYEVNHIANLANAKAILAFHECVKDGMIGPSFAYTPAYAASAKPEDVVACETYEELKSHFWLDVYTCGEYPKMIFQHLQEKGVAPKIEDGDIELLKAAKPDYLGINYYRSITIETNALNGVGNGNFNTTGVKGTTLVSGEPGLYKTYENEYLETTNWDWIIDPMGLRIALHRLNSRYHLPILISENGLGEYDKVVKGTVDDHYRIEYLEAHAKACKLALQDGVDLLGYCTWSFTDLLSWLNGYQKRYGFVYVDKEEEGSNTLKRIKKNSFYWYRSIIENNGADL